jgi:hypothetical protein
MARRMDSLPKYLSPARALQPIIRRSFNDMDEATIRRSSTAYSPSRRKIQQTCRSRSYLKQHVPGGIGLRHLLQAEVAKRTEDIA